VLLHAQGKHTIAYADVAQVAARLIEKTLDQLDSVRLQPLLEEFKAGVVACEAAEQSPTAGPSEVRDRRGTYLH